MWFYCHSLTRNFFYFLSSTAPVPKVVQACVKQQNHMEETVTMKVQLSPTCYRLLKTKSKVCLLNTFGLYIVHGERTLPFSLLGFLDFGPHALFFLLSKTSSVKKWKRNRLSTWKDSAESVCYFGVSGNTAMPSLQIYEKSQLIGILNVCSLKLAALNLTRLCENLNKRLPYLCLLEENWIICYKCYFSTKIKNQRKFRMYCL